MEEEEMEEEGEEEEEEMEEEGEEEEEEMEEEVEEKGERKRMRKNTRDVLCLNNLSKCHLATYVRLTSIEAITFIDT